MEQLFELRRRTFDTPHFRGIEFIETEAKSIINRVPGNALPFNWTLNPYRGCSHSCSYCTVGDTPILMADGRTKPMADIRVGDEVYGTVRDGSYRRYVKTRVLAHWSTRKLAFRTTLGDGTELITSSDHRFLTERGWKYVTGSMAGGCRRPHLTPSNELRGVGSFAEPPKESQRYRLGYLCGMIRGDAHLGSYTYLRKNGRLGTVNRFRLAHCDPEALGRTQRFLSELGVETDEFAFHGAHGNRRELNAIRTQRLAAIERIHGLIEWPQQPDDDWCKGFLAGVFDAEGSRSRGILRISNTDAEIIRHIRLSLERFRFRYALETVERSKPTQVVRVTGGLREHLRFFHFTGPAITRKWDIEGTAIKSDADLQVVAVEPLWIEVPMFDMTTGTGDFVGDGVVHHNCFARVTHTYMDMNAGRDFDSKIVVKVNAPELLRHELAAKRWKGESIAMGTATDPYQRAEGRYRLMPGIIRALIDYRNPFSILTKGTLILRDLDLLREAAETVEVSTALSVGTLDTEAWRKTESGTPHPRKRIDAVRRLNEAGIPCGVMIAPVLPHITDDPRMLMEVVKSAVDAGATHVTPILLHLRPVVREEYMAWLGAEYPELVGTYEEMYVKAYAPKEERKTLAGTIAGLLDAAGGVKPRPEVAERFTRWRGGPARAPEPEEPRVRQPSLL